MLAKNVLLINDDPGLASALQKATEAAFSAAATTLRLDRKFGHQEFPFIILETKKNWAKDLKRLLDIGRSYDDCVMIIGPSGLLKQNSDRIRELASSVLDKDSSQENPSPGKTPSPKKPTTLALEEYLESKLKDFVKQMKTSGGSNLHSIILREIEQPLIRFTLKETRGNQIQAAQLLGMNRNTLRKKIKEFKIPVKQYASRTEGSKTD